MHIDTNTPPGLRAKQTVDMLNSNWPIGTIGVATLAEPKKVDDVAFMMDRMWWDKPFTVSGIDVGAGQATLHLLTSYGVGQDIELRTDDAGLVDRFEVTLRKPPIKQWSDVDAALTSTGARYSYQASRVTGGVCTKVAGSNVDTPPAARVGLQALRPARTRRRGEPGHGRLERPTDHHDRKQGGGFGGLRPPGAWIPRLGERCCAADDLGE